MDEAYESLAMVKFCKVKNHSSNSFKKEVTYAASVTEPPDTRSKADRLEDKWV